MNTKKIHHFILLVSAAMAALEAGLLNELLPPGGKGRQQQPKRLHKDKYSKLFIISKIWSRAGHGFTTVTESAVCF